MISGSGGQGPALPGGSDFGGGSGGSGALGGPQSGAGAGSRPGIGCGFGGTGGGSGHGIGSLLLRSVTSFSGVMLFSMVNSPYMNLFFY